MNKKRNIYLLLPVVLFVWGLISYKIYQQLYPTTPNQTKEISDITYKPHIKKDNFTYTLHKSNRDPFLGTISIKKKYTTKKLKKTNQKKSKKFIFPKIKYKGIVNPKEINKKSVFVIEINGNSELYRIGQTNRSVKLVFGDKKEVKMQFQDSLQTIRIQK